MTPAAMAVDAGPSMSMPPLALYLHLPWCVRKCPYCDFNSHPAPDELPERRYVDALLADLDVDLPVVRDRRLHSIFIGGGTPSLFAPDSIARLLAGVAGRFAFEPGCEVTLEANPGAVDSARFEGFLRAGVNRLSVGVQSFDDACLSAIGRIHDAEAAAQALRDARAVGFERINADLMFALPGQDRAGALADVEQALAVGVTHLSHYHLTLEPNTRFASFPPELPDADTAAAMQDDCAALLRAAGLERYEVSAWASPGEECRHNLNYWRFGDYLGIGAGAHGKCSDPARGVVTRSRRVRHPRHYLERPGEVERDEVGGSQLAFEFMLNALRLCDGVESGLFEARTGKALSSVGAIIADAQRRGLLLDEGGGLRASSLGQAFLDDLVAMFLPEAG